MRRPIAQLGCLVVLALAIGSLSACKKTETGLSIELSIADSLEGVARMDLTISDSQGNQQEGSYDLEDGRVPGGTFATVSFPGGAIGEVTVLAVARDSGGKELARAVARTTLREATFVTVRLELTVALALGDPCESDDQCETASCPASLGLCSMDCAEDSDCGENLCLANLCQIPLKVGWIYVGVLAQEGWTKTHDDGRIAAENALGFVQSEVIPDTVDPIKVAKAIDDLIAGGSKVIMATSFSLREVVKEKADANPDITFMTCSSFQTGENYGSYFGRFEQAYYLAGALAGLVTRTNRLGFVGSNVTPEVVRHINAFTLGARSTNRDVKVEVRWEGFWFDLECTREQAIDQQCREHVQTRALLEAGADVIAHNSDTSRTVATVEQWRKDNPGSEVFSIGNDNVDACTNGPTSCLGTVYWSWGNLYTKLFEQIYKKTFDPTVAINENIDGDEAKSVANFKLNDNDAIKSQIGIAQFDELAVTVEDVRRDLVGDPNFAFQGPYNTNSQRKSPVGAGENAEAEYTTMCWFVEGVVEREDDDRFDADLPAADAPEVQATVPGNELERSRYADPANKRLVFPFYDCMFNSAPADTGGGN